MSNFIPIVIEPYPDELLFSWIKRLANANGLSFKQFYTTYFDPNSLYQIPIDMRKGFLEFCKLLNCAVDEMELYFQLSTTQFELSFLSPAQQLRFLNNIVRPESKLNTHASYSFISKPKMCLECMKEDEEKYGEYYIHRSHQLSGVVTCHKHNSALYEVNKECRYEYKYERENLSICIENITKADLQYAKYAHYLSSNKLITHADDILSIILTAMNPTNELTRAEVAENVAKMLNNPAKKDKWIRNGLSLLTQDAIKILMHLFPSPSDFMNKVKPYSIIVKRHCDNCNQDYYTTQYAIDSGWECPYCDSVIPEEDLFKRLVSVCGKNEYIPKTEFTGLCNKVVLYHKTCGKDFVVSAGNFLFSRRHCSCTQRISRDEAEERMKKYPDFELIDFSGATGPATIRHKVCGEIFEVSGFVVFTSNPKCRCCEITPIITQEELEKRVKEVVGNEYTVTGTAKTIMDRVSIRHNVCGHVHEFKPIEFLSGSRCPQCYRTTSRKKLEVMLREYADERYDIVGRDNYRLILCDNKTGREIKLKAKNIIQEILRPTPSPILPTNKKHNIDKSLTTWDRWYQLFLEYKQEFGTPIIKKDGKYKGNSLAYWCVEQRTLFHKGLLSDDKLQLLKDAGFVFDVVFYNWNQRFEEYKAYVKETGDTNPLRGVVHNGNSVGSWAREQKRTEAQGKIKPMYKELLLEFNPDFFNK